MSDKKHLNEFAPAKKSLSIKPSVRGGIAGLAAGAAITAAANNPEIRDAAGKAVDWAKEKAGQVGSWMKDKADDFEKNLDKKANPASNSKEEKPKEEKPTESPKNDVPAKTETPPAGSAAAKMTFNQAYAKARSMAKPGQDPNKMQFKFDRGGGEKVYQAAATKKDYVPMSKQIKVDIGSEPKTSTSNTTSTNSDTLKPVDTSTMGPTKLSGPEDQGPTNAKWYGDPNRKPGNPEESESGGKKKKMSEETNPLIAAFLKLQETKTANVFEAAKKMSSKEKSLASLGHPKDKITKKDVLIGRGVLPRDVEEGAGEETAKKETSMSVTMDNKPSTPAQTTAATSGPSATEKKALDTKIKTIAKEEVELDEISVSTAWSYSGKKMEKERKGLLPGEGEPTSKTELKNMKNAAERTDKDYYKKRGFKKVTATEEVEFSQAEIDHINSFFEAVAPSRAEPTKGVNPSVSNISLTDDTLAEGRPKKNPTPESTERDARQHIQVIAGRAAAGNTLDFPHNDGSKSKITPAMGRKITSHLQGLKPAERQAAVNKMHASSEGLKI